MAALDRYRARARLPLQAERALQRRVAEGEDAPGIGGNQQRVDRPGQQVRPYQAIPDDVVDERAAVPVFEDVRVVPLTIRSAALGVGEAMWAGPTR